MGQGFSYRGRIGLIGALAGLVLLALVGFLVASSGKAPSSLANNSAVSPAVTVSSPDAAITSSRQAGDEYLALGDSVAYGVGASPPQELGYPAVFYQQYLKKAQPNITNYRNLALPGETTTSFISRPNSKSQLELALNELENGQKGGPHVSLISLTIGGNDVLAARGKSQAQKAAVLEDFDSHFQKILAKLAPYIQSGKTELIVTTYYNPFGITGVSGNDDNAWAIRFNATIVKRATEYKAKVADFFTPVVGHEKDLTWIGGGDIHPNANGHAALAAALWQADSRG